MHVPWVNLRSHTLQCNLGLTRLSSGALGRHYIISKYDCGSFALYGLISDPLLFSVVFHIFLMLNFADIFLTRVVSAQHGKYLTEELASMFKP